MKTFKCWLENRYEQVGQIERLLMRLKYMGIDVLSMPPHKLEKHLVINNLVPTGINPERFAVMVQSIAKGQFDPTQDMVRLNHGE